MDTSNIHKICCIAMENKKLKDVIQQQSDEIGRILQEKQEIFDQYNILLQSIGSHNTSNIVVDNTSNI